MRIEWGRSLVVVGVFVLVGPFVGFVTALGWSISQVPADQPRLQSLMLLSGLFTFILGYLIGGPSALLTGLVAAVASPRIGSNLAWILIVTACGTAVALAFQPVLSPQISMGLMASCSAVASLSCAIILALVRPRRRHPNTLGT